MSEKASVLLPYESVISNRSAIRELGAHYERDGIALFYEDVINLYKEWDSPVVIISDGGYGISGFPGDPPTPGELPDWYEKHIELWTSKSTPLTTLWFWNTEIGWANVHPILQKYGWRYINCHIWNKGLSHIAGNSNTQTLRKFPVVTEVCVQYVKEPIFDSGNRTLNMQNWLRYEWERSGLPLRDANKACGVKNAASRKYLTKDSVWYYPPPEAFIEMAEYANKYGKSEGKPYFTVNEKPFSREDWEKMRAKFRCKIGVTNVWETPPLNGKERIKNGNASMHLNQKPLKLIKLLIESSSDEDDLIWEPFGGLCTSAIASHNLHRRCVSAEINKDYFKIAVDRLRNEP